MGDIDLLEQKICWVEKNSKDWWKEVQKDIEELKDTISDLPDKIADRIDRTIDLKIETKVQRLENKLLWWLVGLTVSVITSFGLIIFNFLKG